MHIRTPKLQLLRRGAKRSEDDLSCALLLGVWGLIVGRDVHYCAAYTDHCSSLLGLLSGQSCSQMDRNDIIDLVGVVGASLDKSVGQMKHDVRAVDPKWMICEADDDSIVASLDFVIRLWLFIRPQFGDDSRTLSQVVASQLPARATHQPQSIHLTRDFCAKSLTRKGGIKIEWTSYLSDHLTFVGKARLRVFRHVAALRKYSQSKERLVHQVTRSCLSD
jgi:hypothetical protein